jgi:hypothetical protein
MNILCAILAVLSIWDYPERQPQHEQLRMQFMQAIRAGNTRSMEDACRKGTQLLPDDPTWAYNLACALAYRNKPDAALDQLEKAIDLGFRDSKAIAEDSDLKRISRTSRFKDLVKYAEEMKERPLMMGPMAVMPATGVFGKSIALGAQNLSWDFDRGCFVANLKLAPSGRNANSGDLYMNRDGGHSRLAVTNYPGLTEIKLDQEGRLRKADLDFPNIKFPYPVFGNCSRASLHPVYWRSLPRSLMTDNSRHLGRMADFYLSNQIWVYPVNADYPPVGTNGDCFVSVAPYWLATQGKSWSDQYYLRAALEVSGSLDLPVKREIVARGLLAPTVQALIRKSLKSVDGSEEAYLTAASHPTCFPPDGLDLARLKRFAGGLRMEEIMPVAVVKVVAEKSREEPLAPECIYSTPCASAFILRTNGEKRAFHLLARGGEEYAFKVVHGNARAVRISPRTSSAVKVEIDTDEIAERIDIAVFARNAKSPWGAPSFVCFSVPESTAPYYDPVLRVHKPVEVK